MLSPVRVVQGLLVVGGRRLHHLRKLKGDVPLQRFCGLHDLPTDRSEGMSPRQFTDNRLKALQALIAEVVADKIKLLRARLIFVPPLDDNSRVVI